VEHFKDCIVNAEHYALRDITRPITDHYRGEAWTTALAIVRGRRDAARRDRRAVHGQLDEAVTPEDRQADPSIPAARITGRGHKTRAFEPCARRHRASAG